MKATNTQSSPRTLKRTKTLYTPVFYSGRSPSSSISTPTTSSAKPTSRTPSSYLDYLSRTHVALAQIVEEVPPSRPGSPTVEGEGEEAYLDMDSKARVEALRERVREMYEYAGGDPADGKWGLLAQLLRTTRTRGRCRWTMTGEDVGAAMAGSSWVLANTEAEWLEWEKKIEEDERVKRKVQSWQRTVDVDVGLVVDVGAVSEHEEGTKVDGGPGKGKAKTSAVAGPGLVQVKMQPTAKAITHDPKDPSPLGFNVVKRTNTNLGNKASGQYKPANGATAGRSKPKSNPNPKPRSSNVSDESVEVIVHEQMNEAPIPTPAKGIADISEAFLPPSFPSQLPTSTPNPRHPNPVREKPPPIPVLPASLPSSPQNIEVHEVYGRKSVTNTPSSLPIIPSSPVRDPSAITSRKRHLSVTPERALKKARTMPSLLSSPLVDPVSIDPLPPSSPPSTPINGNDKGNRAPPLVTPKRPGQLPTLTELLASAKKGKVSPKGKGRRISSGTVDRVDGKDTEDAEKAKVPFPPKEERQRRPDDPYAINMDFPFDASPAKSLSSLAESDSDSDPPPGSPLMPNFTHDDEGFKPICSSTQAQLGESQDGVLGTGLGRTSSGFAFGYNSQFDVEGEVDRVSELLERDVDFDGWLRDVSVEAGEDEVVVGLGESP